MESKLKEGSVGDEREFHELAMNYRGASVGHVAKAYESLAAFVDARLPRSASVQGADDYKQIAHLIGVIYMAGDFKAETAAERDLEALLVKTGHRYANWAEVDAINEKAAASTPAVQPLAAIAEQQASIHCQQFHELAMDYRGAGTMQAHGAYVALTDYINARLAASEASASPIAQELRANMEELHFNAQRLRNVVKLLGMESEVPESDGGLDGACGSVLGRIAAKLRESAKQGKTLTDEQIEAKFAAIYFPPKEPGNELLQRVYPDDLVKVFRDLSAPVPAPAPLAQGDDTQRMEWLEQWLVSVAADNVPWTSFGFDTSKTAREQIDAEIAPQVPETPVKVGAESNQGGQQ